MNVLSPGHGTAPRRGYYARARQIVAFCFVLPRWAERIVEERRVSQVLLTAAPSTARSPGLRHGRASRNLVIIGRSRSARSTSVTCVVPGRTASWDLDTPARSPITPPSSGRNSAVTRMSMCVVEGRYGTHARALVNAATAPPVKRMDSRRDRAKPCAAGSLSTSPLHSASLWDCWTGRLHGRERCAHRGQAQLGVVWAAIRRRETCP
jgi:hypothetical protein